MQSNENILSFLLKSFDFLNFQGEILVLPVLNFNGLRNQTTLFGH